MIRRSSCGPIACWTLARTSSLVTWSLYEMRNILRQHLISMTCIFLWSSAVRVHDSHAYRKMNLTRERINCTLETERNTSVISNWFQPCQCCCCLCYHGEYLRLGTLTVITEPRYLKLVTVSSFCPFTLISVLMPLVLFVISLVFSALISMP